MEIRCRKGTCRFNNGCSCLADHVEVSKVACCNSFTPDPLKENVTVSNGNLFEISKELSPRNLRNVPLSCRSRNCLFNKETKCCANGIFVIDDEENAGCATYIER